MLSIFLKSPVVFTENPKYSPTPFDLAGFPVWDRNPKVIFGPLKKDVCKTEIMYCDEAGCQRNNVEEEFYSEFPPDIILRDIKGVFRILELTEYAAKSQFRREFIENWESDRSFVQISW